MRRRAGQLVADGRTRHVHRVGQGGREAGIFIHAEPAVVSQHLGRKDDRLVTEVQMFDVDQRVETRDAIARLHEDLAELLSLIHI